MSGKSHAPRELSAPRVHLLVHETEAHRRHRQPHEQVQAAEVLLVAAAARCVPHRNRGHRHEAEVHRVEGVPAEGGGEGRRAQAHVRHEEEEGRRRGHGRRRRGAGGRRRGPPVDQGHPRRGVVAEKGNFQSSYSSLRVLSLYLEEGW